MSDAEAFFRIYAADRRQQSVAMFDRDDLGHLVRYTARDPDDEGFIVFASLVAGHEALQIDEQMVYFRALSQSFEWKVYAFDRPSDLVERLAVAGFEADEAETLMKFDASSSVDRPSGNITIRRVTDDAGLDDVLRIQSLVWSRDVAWLRRALRAQMRSAPSTLALFCAYQDGQPAGSGWIDYPAGSRFPEMRGGSVVSEMRGRGVYRALLDARLHDALGRGYDTLCVDALPTSRPILEHLGFRSICATTPMRLPVAPRHLTAR